MSSSGSSEHDSDNEDQESGLDSSDFEHPSTSKKNSSQTKSNVSLSVGAKFDSITQIEESILAFGKEKFCFFYKRDCETIEKCRKRGITRWLNADLKYYYLKYSCIHGGKKFKSVATGIRLSSTFQKKCEAMFSFTCSSDGKYLQLTKLIETHNHICSEKLYNFLPQVRAMTTHEKFQVKELLNLGANKKIVKQKLAKDFGKQILLKDLSNVMLRQEGQNNLKNVLEKLQKDFGAECRVFEEGGEMKGLFFVTPEMKRSMAAYFEFLGIDATFKLLDIRAPVYLMIVEDSEGSTEIVAVRILINEDAESMRWLLQTFKTIHPSWSSTKCIMADKDLLERRIIKEEFESARVLICVFHTLRTFNREVSCDKLSITPEQRDMAKELFQKMVYSSTETEYMRYYEKIKELPAAIVNYFDKNWHEIRSEWILSVDFMQSTFLNTTNNRIESLNAKVKSVVKLYSTLEEFIESFFVLVGCLHSERDFKAAFNYQKTCIIPYQEDSAEWLYCYHLTRLAFKFVNKELSSFRRGKFIFTKLDDEHFEFRLDESMVVASEKSCECPAFSSMMLPCRFILINHRSICYLCSLWKLLFMFLYFFSSHIFIVKEQLGCDLYDPSICNRRWTREYYCDTQRVFSNERNEDTENPEPIVCSKPPRRYVSTENGRFRIIRDITNALNTLGSEVTGEVFLRRVKMLNDIREAWVENREVRILPVATEVLPNVRTSTPISSHNRAELNFDEVFTAASEELSFDEIDENQNLIEMSGQEGGEKNVETDTIKANESLTKVMDPNDIPSVGQVCTTSSVLNLNIQDIKVPCAVKRRGRPKGSLKTVIGLSKKRRIPMRTRKLPFLQLSLSERALVILKWLVDEKIAFSAVHNGINIPEESVETRPNEVSDSIIDEDVNIESVRRYFSVEAWKIVEEFVKQKKDSNVFVCAMCDVDLDTTVDDESHPLNQKFSIRCDYCMSWYHLSCVALKKLPKTKFWQCKKC
ncbi:uncharacterized protein [Venturia canescens]|uniref:uncharacterized protein n=1 Tax=Venturia canescens TaxID=32260 RepID=UPI001C9C8D43|nr:uncharacterized protein LOC122407884 [Venturia canescens]